MWFRALLLLVPDTHLRWHILSSTWISKNEALPPDIPNGSPHEILLQKCEYFIDIKVVLHGGHDTYKVSVWEAKCESRDKVCNCRVDSCGSDVRRIAWSLRWFCVVEIWFWLKRHWWLGHHQHGLHHLMHHIVCWWPHTTKTMHAHQMHHMLLLHRCGVTSCTDQCVAEDNFLPLEFPVQTNTDRSF